MYSFTLQNHFFTIVYPLKNRRIPDSISKKDFPLFISFSTNRLALMVSFPVIKMNQRWTLRKEEKGMIMDGFVHD